MYHTYKLTILNNLKNKLLNEPDLLNLVEDDEFIGLIDSLLPEYELIKRYLYSKDAIYNNLNFSIKMNYIIKCINNICLEYNKIILYGNGNFTKIFKILFNSKVVAISDKQISNESILPSEINTKDFECIVIMVLGREKEITEELVKIHNIDRKKIIGFTI